MAFSDGNYKQRTFAGIKWDKQNKKIFFQINAKDKEPEQRRQYEGRLKEVKVKKWEYENKPKESIQFIFDDGETETWIEAGWSFVSQSILNTLAGADAIGMVKINLYTNKKGYGAAYIEINGQEGKWKYEPNDTRVPEVKRVKLKGEDVIDDFDRIEFYKNSIIPEINSKIQNEFLVESEMRGTDQKTNKESVSHDDIPSDLPF